MYNNFMFDAHCHIKVKDSICCTSEFLPQFYDFKPIENFASSESEIGLDKRYTSIMPIEKQVKLLNSLLILAKSNNKPVTLHVVNETQTAIEVLKQIQPVKQTVIWHCFTGSAETAAILNSLGIIISIGPRFNGDIAKTVKANPLFVLETDYEGQSLQEHDRILADVYSKVSLALGLSVSEIELHCKSTLSKFLP